MTLSKKYGPTQWLGVRPRTLPQPEEAEGGPVQWMLQRCSSAAGIYLDVEVMHTANASEGAAAGKEVRLCACMSMHLFASTNTHTSPHPHIHSSTQR